MTRLTEQKIYDLLPAIYRLKDYENGEPLKALISVIAEQARAMERDIEDLYDDWFIETCAEWLVPYIGEQFAVRGLQEVNEAVPFSRRAVVANTIAYRRRKGTPHVLEQLAFDTSGYQAHVVEYFENLDTNQNVNHVRLHAPRTPDLRDANSLELIGGAFDSHKKTVDVRSVSFSSVGKIRGKHNIDNIGLHLWRLQSYQLPQVELVGGPGNGNYWIHPSADDAPLFNPPQTETEIESISQEYHLPVKLRALPLYKELEARRLALVNGEEPKYAYFDNRQGRSTAFELYLDGDLIPPEQIMICDLSNWRQPPDNKSYQKEEIDGTLTAVDLPIQAAVDPVLGRVSLASLQEHKLPRLTYAYGFSGDIGSGAYSRQDFMEKISDREISWQIGVNKTVTTIPGELVNTLVDALNEWALQPAGTVGLISVMDSSRYEESFTGAQKIEIPPGSRLILLAADWPALQVPNGLPGELRRQTGRVQANNVRATWVGNIEVRGLDSLANEAAGDLLINGFYIDGSLSVVDGNLGNLWLNDICLSPPMNSLEVANGNESLEISVSRSICGPININSQIAQLNLDSVIVQADTGLSAINAALIDATICESTLIGTATFQQLNASNCLFTETVTVERRQEGCVRYSYLAPNSETPKRYRCQPGQTLQDLPESQHEGTRARLRPSFSSLDIRQPAYGQLNKNTAEEIMVGADNGSEMGAFNRLQQSLRLANARLLLKDYLRFGLQAGFFFES